MVPKGLVVLEEAGLLSLLLETFFLSLFINNVACVTQFTHGFQVK